MFSIFGAQMAIDFLVLYNCLSANSRLAVLHFIVFSILSRYRAFSIIILLVARGSRLVGCRDLPRITRSISL